MSNPILIADHRENIRALPDHRHGKRMNQPVIKPHQTAAAHITQAASTQTYYTIRFLVDRDRVADAYRAYAYFRWVDDWLDQVALDQTERLVFIQRQQSLIERVYQGHCPTDVTPEEQMLIDLIRSNPDPNSGLHAYVYNLMAVMAFDAKRQGRLISAKELDDYTHHLAVGVTEALHYFIGHNDPSPQTEARYYAVTAAHITHMLRDTFDDFATDYFNIPCEYLERHAIQPTDIHSPAYRAWVKKRVQLARAYFKRGETYLTQVPNRNCRLAGYAYITRFRSVLDTIERDDYYLCPHYHQRKTLHGKLRMLTYILSHILRSPIRGKA